MKFSLHLCCVRCVNYLGIDGAQKFVWIKSPTGRLRHWMLFVGYRRSSSPYTQQYLAKVKPIHFQLSVLFAVGGWRMQEARCAMH